MHVNFFRFLSIVEINKNGSHVRHNYKQQIIVTFFEKREEQCRQVSIDVI